MYIPGVRNRDGKMNMEAEKEKTSLIEGEAICLRLMGEQDTDNIIKWRNQDFVRRNFIYQKPFTQKGHENWTKTMIDTGKAVQFIICAKPGGEPVGSVYLRDIDRTHKKAEYGIFIGEEKALGRGYGTEAAKLMIRYAFGKEGLHKLMLRVLAGNGQARRSYQKAGFVEEAYLKEEVFLEGAYRDVVLMAVLNRQEEREGLN